jgi:hypothetical protein
VPFQLGYRPKTRRPRFWSGPSRIESELGNLANGQTNPEGPARLTRRLIMDLVCIVIFETEYSMLSEAIHHLLVEKLNVEAESASRRIPDAMRCV